VRRLAGLAIGQEGEVTVARLEGEIDLSNAEPLRQQIADGVPNDSAGLVIDLTDVSYLDSSGLRLLFDLARRVERRQQRLATVIPRGSPVRDLIAIVGGASMLGVQETREEALARVGSGARPEAG
jgi:anti-anti-sigma factor